jgi:O-antigen/teichoic acid export membrane protein
MTQIRKKGLISTFWIYFGFAIGALNTFLFAKKGFFNTGDYGLSTGLIQIGLLLSTISALGSYGLLFKFFPYYSKRLNKRDNDLLSVTLFIALVGFCIMAVLGIFAQPLILKKFNANSPELVNYFYYSYILALGFLLYTIFEYQGWNLQLQLYTNILREVGVRVFVLVLIILKLLGFLNFHQFLILYCFQYLFIAVLLVYKIYKIGELNIVFKISFVTLRFRKVMLKYLSYGFVGTVVGTLKMVVDILVLSSFSGLVAAGVYTLASFVATILQAPYRSLASITTPILSTAWKEKNFKEINRLYKRTSINLLLFSLVVFGFIWLNFEPFVYILNLNKEFLDGKNVLLLLCIANIVEMGTGINGQIIGTSTLWKFEFYTNIILGIIITTCSYFFTKYVFGINGPAVALLLGVIVYNTIRILFLYQKFKFLPFTIKTVYTIIALPTIIILCKIALQYLPFYAGLLLTNLCMIVGFVFCILKFELSPDVKPVVNNLFKRFGIKKQLN